MSQTRSFKRTVVVLDRNLLPKDRDDLQRWLKHAGAKFRDEITDDVTHFIVAKDTWFENSKLKEMETMLTAARRKKTVFLMCKKWVVESLSFNKGIPKDESDCMYTWDIKHAKQVWPRRERRRKQAQRAKTRLRQAQKKAALATSKKRDAEGGVDSTCINDVKMIGDDNLPNEVSEQKKARKLQDMTECGLVYDRRLLEFERDQALRGFRPYVDEKGVLYMVTLVRKDIATAVKERYEIKLLDESACDKAELDMGDRDMTTDADSVSNGLSRFTISDDTKVRYLDDDSCYPPPRSSKCSGLGSSTGILTPLCSSADNGSLSSTCSTIFEGSTTLEAPVEYWAPHMPFSSQPVVQYTIGPGPPCINTLEARPPPRVYLDEYVAYSLQLYESYDIPEPTPEPVVTTPRRNFGSYTSFTSLLPKEFQPEPKRLSTIERSISPPTTPPHVLEQTSNRKKYHLVIHYTRRPTRNSTKETKFVPCPGGKHQGRDDLDYAMHVWKWFFHEKTKMKWDDVVSGKHIVTGRRDSGVSLSEDIDDPAPDSTGFVTKPPAIVPSKLERKDSAVWEGNDTPLALQDISQQCAKKPFTYVPNQKKYIERIAKHYGEYYEEDWLSLDLGKLKFDIAPDTMKVVAESKPAFQVCDENMDACECGAADEVSKQND